MTASMTPSGAQAAATELLAILPRQQLPDAVVLEQHADLGAEAGGDQQGIEQLLGAVVAIGRAGGNVEDAHAVSPER